ncbi:MAG: ribosome-associated translation inhibitor RaiA [Patescibacteria group bacterium]
MRLNLKSTNYELNAEIKEHIEDKFGELDKYFNNIQQIDVEVGLTRKGQQKGKIFFCEVNVSVPKKLLRFRKEFENMVKAINEAKKGIQMEIKKYKERLNG